jgi:hypothetical protein
VCRRAVVPGAKPSSSTEPSSSSLLEPLTLAARSWRRRSAHREEGLLSYLIIDEMFPRYLILWRSPFGRALAPEFKGAEHFG